MREITYRSRRKKRRMLRGCIAGILILAALVIFGLFRVQEMVVSGNSIYTSKDIENSIMQDGLCKNTLYLLWKYRDDSAIGEALPFLSSIEVEMENPFKVRVRVYEKPEIGYFLNGTDYVYFDRDGLIVEISKKLRENVPEITGVTITKPVRYELLSMEDEELLNVVMQIGQLLSKNGIVPNEIKFDEERDITLYFAKIRVNLGKSSELEEKIGTLKSVYDKVSNMEGVLHMETFTEDAKTITFKQGETEETVTVDESEKIQSESETGEEQTEAVTEEEDIPTYSESDGTFSTDAQGNSIYTDAVGNTTPNVDGYQYTDENGGIITDGYGYIDPYTGAYIIGQ